MFECEGFRQSRLVPKKGERGTLLGWGSACHSSFSLSPSCEMHKKALLGLDAYSFVNEGCVPSRPFFTSAYAECPKNAARYTAAGSPLSLSLHPVVQIFWTDKLAKKDLNWVVSHIRHSTYRYFLNFFRRIFFAISKWEV